jgi:hypothetical protein
MDKLSSANAISFKSIIFNVLFPRSETSSKLSSILGIDSFPNKTSLNPYLLAFARNFSLQIGLSSTFPQTGITLMVLKSVNQLVSRIPAKEQ